MWYHDSSLVSDFLYSHRKPTTLLLERIIVVGFLRFRRGYPQGVKVGQSRIGFDPALSFVAGVA